ncbi:MAG: hypothetical protein IPJ88_10450 [Myxococcales bacterium]|nr:MAG: hypothetical protein IPJ88_10450 [Myxococcales bacterium]
MTRSFVEIDPVTNQQSLSAKVVATLRPRELLGDGRVVFINVGKKDGVVLGNRFLVIREGDTWQKELYGKPVELGASTPLPEQPEHYPKETIAEMRVVDVQKNTAACMITSSRRPVAIGDTVEMPRGY